VTGFYLNKIKIMNNERERERERAQDHSSTLTGLDPVSPQIAVILPVYNIEKYLKECLESVKNQSFKDFICICVNDGSTDSSPEILNKFAKQDKRFKIIHQKNHGAGFARAVGIKQVFKIHIPYITFIDPDDFVSKKYLEFLYTAMKSGDYNLVRCANNMFSKKNYNNIVFNEESLILDKVKQNLLVLVWGNLYSAELFANFNNDNYEYIGYKKYPAEDSRMNLLVIVKNNIKQVFVKNTLYAYRQRASSAVRDIGKDISYQKHIYEPFKPINNVEKNKANMYITVLSIYSLHGLIVNEKPISKEVRANITKMLKLLPFNELSKIGDKKILFVKIFGINFYIFIKRMYHHFKHLTNKDYKKRINDLRKSLKNKNDLYE
jgi:glycosyltransferase involved in cell wall biosynthesis